MQSCIIFWATYSIPANDKKTGIFSDLGENGEIISTMHSAQKLLIPQYQI